MYNGAELLRLGRGYVYKTRGGLYSSYTTLISDEHKLTLDDENIQGGKTCSCLGCCGN